MSKKNRLSHSACNQYMSCPKKYYYHYVEKLRTVEQSAALLWGSSVDTAISTVLIDVKWQNVDYLAQEYEIVFRNAWRRGMVNKVMVDLMDNENIVYAATDYDPELLTYADLEAAHVMLSKGGKYEGVYTARMPTDCLEAVDAVRNRKEANGWENLSIPERQFYNYMHWVCMYTKGMLLIKKYIEQIVPKIKNVLAVQRQIDLTNEEGDSVIGYVDAVLEWEDGRVVVFDNKTAARAYEWDSVLTSPQLALYVHALENEFKTRTAGFIVMSKQIDKQRVKTCKSCGHVAESRAKTCDATINGKRCGGEWNEKIDPQARIDVIISDIPARTEEIVLENYMDINHMIKQEVFPRNLNACDRPFACPFKNLCWKGQQGSLIKLEEDK